MKVTRVAVARDAIVRAFEAWGRDEPSNSALWRMAGPEGCGLAVDALEELIELRTGAAEDWYLRNHYRYAGMREMQRKAARALLASFLERLQSGKVKVG